MIGSSFKHVDGGWTLSIHGKAEDAKAFEELLQWIMSHEVQLREGEVSEETKRYEKIKDMLEAIPDVAAKVDALMERTGLVKALLLSKALGIYELVLTSLVEGDKLTVVKKDGTSVDIPLDNL